MSADDLDELRELFDFYDRDGNGVIDRDEFARLCRALDDGFSEDELAAGLDAIDGNHNGVIEFSEFVGWWRDRA
ncbi:MAG: EF-hand domain-containing protein [Myxococcales bacterium]|nr:EF-hand domain-containing protein [Myxococcales bacterium]MCB9548680.1 EF-hand domain-containing protein [Myxococcales bacterium]